MTKDKSEEAKETLLETQNKYLEALEDLGSNKKAAEKVHIGPRTAYYWLKGDILGFVERFEKSRWVLVAEVESSLFSVALGHDRCGPVELRAKETILKAYKPERYGDKLGLNHGVSPEAKELFEILLQLKNKHG